MEAAVGLILIAAMMAVVAGIALVAIGWRGRRVGDHPHCARCGFDLFGRPEDSTRCPECGQDITQAGTMKIGLRQRRPRPLWIGSAMLVPGLLVLAVVGLALFSQSDFNRYKPVSWLLWQADLAAADELNRRHVAGLLSSQQVQRVVDRILVFQGDADRPWLTEWGDLLERARAAGEVDDEQWRRYAQQAVPLRLVARPRVRRGDPIPVEVHHEPIRTASKSVLWVHTRIKRAFLEDLRLGGFLEDEIRSDGVSMPIGEFRVSKSRTIFRQKLIAEIEAQKAYANDMAYELRAIIELTAWDTPQVGWRRRGEHVWKNEVPLADTIVLSPEDQPTVEVLDDPQMHELVEGTLHLDGGEVRIQNTNIRLWISAHRPPVGLAITVCLRDADGQEWPLYYTITGSAGARHGWRIDGWLDGFDADEVDVILRSDPDLAAATVDLTTIWGGEIVFEKVPVRWDETAQRPTVLPEWMRTIPPPDDRQ